MKNTLLENSFLDLKEIFEKIKSKPRINLHNILLYTLIIGICGLVVIIIINDLTLS